MDLMEAVEEFIDFFFFFGSFERVKSLSQSLKELCYVGVALTITADIYSL